MTASVLSGLSIVICTFHRPVLLKKALESIAGLTNPTAIPIEIVVVDNSDEGDAYPVIDATRVVCPYPVIAVAAHPANISVARNAGVRAAKSEIVAFIDDDQTLEPGWLIAVTDGLAKHPHDVFFGGVTPVAEAPERMDGTARSLFTRWLDAAAGQDLVAMGPDKTRGIALATNNCIFRRSTTLTDEKPFDAAFGNGGGEDFDLFCRLQVRGRRFGWLPEAMAFEFVPATRCNPDYLRRRFFAGGQAYALAVSLNSNAPRLQRWRQRAVAATQFLLLLAAAPRYLLRGDNERRAWRYRLAGILGKLSFRSLEPIYRQAALSERNETQRAA